MFSVITNIFNTKTKGPTLMELATATGKLQRFIFCLKGTDHCRAVKNINALMLMRLQQELE
jgi:hypothetical protein